MTYVVYNAVTTLLHGRDSYSYKTYKTEAAAKAAVKRLSNKGVLDMRYAEVKHFFANIEKKEIRHGIVHSEGAEFEVGVNTPWTSGPWSETYWCS